MTQEEPTDNRTIYTAVPRGERWVAKRYEVGAPPICWGDFQSRPAALQEAREQAAIAGGQFLP